MKTKDASKKAPRNKPKPFTPDFMPKPQSESQVAEGVTAHTVDEVKAILAKGRV